MAENNTPVAEAPAVVAVGEEPVVPAKVEANMERAESERTDDNRTSDNRSGDNRRNRDDESDDRDEREYRRRDRNRDDRPEAGRLQGPTDLMPELDPSEMDGERQELENTRAYEVTYIALANNAEAQEATQQRLKTMIEDSQGAVDHVRVTEPRRLAFPINKQAEGVYVVVNARFNQKLIEELDRFFKLEDNVLRHIVLREGR